MINSEMQTALALQGLQATYPPILVTIKSLLQLVCNECKGVSRVIIPPCRGVNQSQDEHHQSPREYQRARDNQFFSRGSRACRHTSLRCVDQHLVVQWLRGVA